MAENQIQLTLTPIQQSQYFAHLFVYLFDQASNPARSQHKATNELVQEVAYRLFYECRQECRERTFTVSVEEAQAVKDAFAYLSHAYAQRPALKSSAATHRASVVAGKVSTQSARATAHRPGFNAHSVSSVAHRTRTHRTKKRQASVQRDLAACLLVLEQAERHATTQAESRKDDER